jgi:hypothetical protein
MCFSAQASFVAGTGLAIVGLLSIQKNKVKKLQPLAVIPLLFGIQQLCEGVVWVTQNNPSLAYQNELARYAYLFFAYVIWPFWIPFTVYMIAPNGVKKRRLASLVGAGTVVASTLLWALVKVGATSAITCNHIEYALNMQRPLEPFGLVWYCIATITPFFVIGKNKFNKLGAFLLISVLVSYFFYYVHLTSVWCFFVAIFSALIYRML